MSKINPGMYRVWCKDPNAPELRAVERIDVWAVSKVHAKAKVQRMLDDPLSPTGLVARTAKHKETMRRQRARHRATREYAAGFKAGMRAA